MPKVSVILPTYNVAQYLPKCIDSLLNQTLKDIEIIFIDDASPDNSVDIIKSYNDPRIKLIRHTENKYTAEARNSGINTATGEYIFFLDPDDYIEFDMLEKLYILAKENDADITKGVMKFMPANNIRSRNASITKNKFNFQFMMNTGLYRKKMIDDHNIRFSIDVICGQFQMVYYANKIVTCEDAIYYYMKRPDSCVNSGFSIDKWKKLNIAGANKTLDFINTHPINKKNYLFVVNSLILNLYQYGYNRMTKKNREFAKPILNECLDCFWNNVKYKEVLAKSFFTLRLKYA